MRRTFSTLAILSLLALSLTLPLSPASAGDNDEHRDRAEQSDHDDDHADDHDNDGHRTSGECERDGAADVWAWADSRNWTWEHSGDSGFGYWLGLVLYHRTESDDDDDCESPDAPEPTIPDDPAPPVVATPEVPELPANPSETPTPSEPSEPPGITPEQPSEPPDLAPTEPPIDTSVGGATETNPGDNAGPPAIEAPGGGQQANRPPIVQRVPAAIPRLSASVDCSARVIATELSNVGDAPGLVDVFLVTESVRSGVALPVGEVVRVDFPVSAVAEGETLSVLVADAHGVVATSEVTVDCEAPADIEASIVVRCQANVIDLTLSNRGEEAASADVLVERSDRVAVVDLAGGQTQTVEVAAAGRSAVPLRVVVDGVDIVRRDVSIDCPQPYIDQPDIVSSTSISCVSSEILVSVWNRGSAAGVVAISSDGSSLADVPVNPGTVIVAGLPLDGSQTMATVNVTDGGGNEVVSAALLNPCASAAHDESPPCSSIVVSNGVGSIQTIVTTPSPGEPWWVDTGLVPPAADSDGILSAARSCSDPSADFIVDCGAGLLQVVLSNAGSIPTRLAILVDGNQTGSTVDVGAGEMVTVDIEISDSGRVAVVEAGRVEPLTTLELKCGSGGAAPRTAYAVFAFSIGGSLLAMVGDPRKLWFLIR